MENIEEIWKEIPGSKGKYFASNLGRIRSECYTKSRILKQQTSTNGYKHIYYLGKSCRVHVLIGMAFLGYEPRKGKVIDHINSDRTDNRLSNLRITTQSINIFRGRKVNNKSGIVGVMHHRNTNRWQAYIKKDNKTIYLGNFDNKKDATKARKEAEIKYYPSVKQTVR